MHGLDRLFSVPIQKQCPNLWPSTVKSWKLLNWTLLKISVVEHCLFDTWAREGAWCWWICSSYAGTPPKKFWPILCTSMWNFWACPPVPDITCLLSWTGYYESKQISVCMTVWEDYYLNSKELNNGRMESKWSRTLKKVEHPFRFHRRHCCRTVSSSGHVAISK